MEEIYTENLLIRYLYKESDLFEKLELEDVIENDPGFRSLFSQLKNAFEMLPKAHFTPANHLVQRILLQSREAALQI